MEFIADVPHVRKILKWIEQQLRVHRFEPSQMRHIELASEEALVNIIRHAYQGRPETVEVEVRLFPTHAEVVFLDHGTPFSPLDAAPMDPNVSLTDRDIGGLGIHLMRKCVDAVRYERKGGKNVLTLVIRKKM